MMVRTCDDKRLASRRTLDGPDNSRTKVVVSADVWVVVTVEVLAKSSAPSTNVASHRQCFAWEISPSPGVGKGLTGMH